MDQDLLIFYALSLTFSVLLKKLHVFRGNCELLQVVLCPGFYVEGEKIPGPQTTRSLV